jgi:hypothetical protein
MYLRQFKHVLDEYDHRNQPISPFSKLHIELLEQFEGSITFTNFIEPLLPKNRTEQPWRKYQLQTSGLLAVNIYAAN